jgi:hypothetical protein
MAQGISYDGCRHDTESEVGQDAVGDKGQCPEQGRGLKDVASAGVAHVGEFVE